MVVTHDPRLISYADRVFEMADGQLTNTPHAHEPAGHTPAAHGHIAHGPHINGGFAPLHPARRPIPNGPRLQLQEPTPKGW